MPRFDGTGPLGQGPLTGGGFGYCIGTQPYYGRSPIWGLGGRARLWGGSRGFGYGGRGFAYGGFRRRPAFYGSRFGRGMRAWF